MSLSQLEEWFDAFRQFGYIPGFIMLYLRAIVPVLPLTLYVVLLIHAYGLFPGIIISWFITQLMVFWTWIFFRLPDLKDSFWVVQNLWGTSADIQFAHLVYVEALGVERIDLARILVGVIIAMAIATAFRRGLKVQLNWPIKLILVPLCFFAVLLLAPEGGLPYIYFDF